MKGSSQVPPPPLSSSSVSESLLGTGRSEDDGSLAYFLKNYWTFLLVLVLAATGVFLGLMRWVRMLAENRRKTLAEKRRRRFLERHWALFLGSGSFLAALASSLVYWNRSYFSPSASSSGAVGAVAEGAASVGGASAKAAGSMCMQDTAVSVAKVVVFYVIVLPYFLYLATGSPKKGKPVLR